MSRIHLPIPVTVQWKELIFFGPIRLNFSKGHSTGTEDCNLSRSAIADCINGRITRICKSEGITREAENRYQCLDKVCQEFSAWVVELVDDNEHGRVLTRCAFEAADLTIILSIWTASVGRFVPLVHSICHSDRSNNASRSPMKGRHLISRSIRLRPAIVAVS
ncbi:hypothetical protein LIPSTDRAFT_241218 [Lipomyces starkeyi NRRL Y-11557]|uniref:Uncharacterized protein n=1 Tax=Lipomyces starkeyi NRRL Y-11557 TaxID=675824 RepID=A0A1E3QC25_LIPST|nr:hypothetical protein LIPSTDRAFT_241218 [Lipomyces starkeyi NRRL Y-11557]